jgi:5'-nucleotidase
VSVAQSDPWQWDTAVDIGHSAARWILERSRGPYVLNINVPGVPIGEINGIHWADLDDFGYFRVANADVVDRKLQFVVGSSSAGTDPASDTALVAKNFVTITPLASIEPAGFPDLDATAVWSPDRAQNGF